MILYVSGNAVGGDLEDTWRLWGPDANGRVAISCVSDPRNDDDSAPFLTEDDLKVLKLYVQNLSDLLAAARPH